MVQLHETIMGKTLIEHTMPEIARQLKKLADAKNHSQSDWIGKEVQIYPGDTHKKWGKIVDMNEHGVTFLITNYTGNDHEWQIGKRTFVSYSSKLSFREIN
jgi:hypothetical protein